MVSTEFHRTSCTTLHDTGPIMRDLGLTKVPNRSQVTNLISSGDNRLVAIGKKLRLTTTIFDQFGGRIKNGTR